MYIVIGIIIGLAISCIELIVMLNRTNKAYKQKAFTCMEYHDKLRNILIAYHKFKDDELDKESLARFFWRMDEELEGVI